MPEREHEKLWQHPSKKPSEQRGRRSAKHAEYVELQAKSNFSFLEGASHPEELVEQAAALGYTAFGIADRSSMAGVVRAHVAAKKVGIPLLVGVEVSLIGMRMLLYPVCKTSYGRLCQLLTKGKLRAEKGCCSLELQDILEDAQDLLGIVVLDELWREGLEADLRALREAFGERFSLAIKSGYGAKDAKRIKRTKELHQELAIPLVATNDVHYHAPERRMLQDVLTCIRNHCEIQDAGFLLAANAERHIKPPREMSRLFREFPEAVKRTLVLAEQAKGFSLDQLRYEYPHEICPEGKSHSAHLRELVRAGARERYPQGIPRKVADQIAHELKLIEELRYERYFLTVHDIVRFARQQQILCQGRGAAANSAVCYVLGITSVDPAQMNLLFERFISKERNEPPDIDIDFEHERREEVIQYIYNRFGRHRAALVAEVISYRTKSSIRDVGKVFGLPLETIETLIKIKSRSAEKAVTPESLVTYDLNPAERAIWHTVAQSEILLGFPRHLSQHVGGFIVSEPPLSTIVPIENAAMADRTVVEWDKDDVDSMGMLKIDVLALGMLTCIRKCFDMLNARGVRGDWGEPLALHTMPKEDVAVYDMICRADTVGVFQIESRAQMSMLPRLKPRCFYDLVIEVAIVRPGPIQGGMVHPFLKRRKGEEQVSYPDERIRHILKDTLGVPIFQEQAMQLASVAAGFTPGESDELRRSMASWKKNKNALAKYGKRLTDGMLKNGYSPEFASTVFEQIKGFGEYGFPQSHAASFALLVYASAWIKCHHPAAFAAGLLNSQPMGFYQPAQIIQDAKNHGVIVRGVDINRSEWNCTLEGIAPALRLGMRVIRGLREREVEKLEAARKEGEFKTPQELWRRSGMRLDQLRALANADAFTSMGLDRQQALWALRRLRDDRLPLFEQLEAPQEQEVALPEISERLHVFKDYHMTGLSLRAHPMSFIRGVLERHGVRPNVELRESAPNGKRITVAGIVLVRQRPGTAKGIMFMTIEDETGIANLIVKQEVRRKFQDALLDSVFLLARGKVQRSEGVVHLLLEEAIDVSSNFAELEVQSRDFH